MRVLNITIGLVILVCIILVSYSHTVLLFNSVGIIGTKGHLATIAVEATFILSCFNLVVARLKKYRPGFFAVAGFFYGSGLTAWSNISYSFEYGYAGWILGAAIPVGLWIAEGIISHSLMKKSSQNGDQSASQTSQVVDEMVDDQPQTNQMAEKVADESAETYHESTNQVVDSTNQPTTTNQESAESADNMTEEERIKKAYLDYLKEVGEPPTQRKWAEKAGVSRYKITKFIEKYGEPKKSA